MCRIVSVRNDGEFAVEVTTGDGRSPFVPHTLKLIDGVEVIGVEVSTGNPHFVVLVDNPEFAVGQRAWTGLGAEICTHPDFPHHTNVEFVRVVSDREIEIRIFERGVGPTTSSGTGSSASATAALAFKRLHLAAQSRCARRRADRRLGWPRHGVASHRPCRAHRPRGGLVKMRDLLKPPPVAPDAAITHRRSGIFCST